MSKYIRFWRSAYAEPFHIGRDIQYKYGGNDTDPMSNKFYRMLSALIAIIFGIVWIYLANDSGAPWFFSLFGVVFIGIAAFIFVKALLS